MYMPDDDDISSTDYDTSDFSSNSRDTQAEDNGNQDDESNNQPQGKKRRVEQNQPSVQNPPDWKDNATARSPFSFTGNSGLIARKNYT